MGIARDRALPATELWPRWWRGRRHGVLVAEIDATLAQIVGSHFHGHPIPGENAYPIFLHLARRIRQRFMAVIELYLEAGVGKQFENNAIEFDQVFFCQCGLLERDGEY